jgi:hypothetical protein
MGTRIVKLVLWGTYFLLSVVYLVAILLITYLMKETPQYWSIILITSILNLAYISFIGLKKEF